MSNNRVIKIFEDRQKKLELSKEETKDLLEMKSIIGSNNLILQADGSLLVRHYVGFVQINKTRLLIYPKISSKSDEDEKYYERSFNILMKMLIYTNFEGVKELERPQYMDKYQGDILEVFIGIFIDELLLQLKRDVSRGYSLQTENQTFIKGKIDFSETIKRNSFKKHLHYVEYDDFSKNILLNRIFKSVINNLIFKTNSKENKLKLRQALLWFEDVDILSLNNEIFEKLSFTRQNLKYKVAFNMAKLFYYNSSPSLTKGNEETFSFLLPVNRLFELYLYKIFSLSLAENQNVKYQNTTKYLAYFDNKEHFLLKPDIIFVKEEQINYIIDAKYKELEFDQQTLGISQADIYQMLAYSVGYQCNNIALIYPKFLTDDANEPNFKEFTIKNQDRLISIKAIKADLELEPKLLVEELNNIMEIDRNIDKER